jgi:hypothetical protein
MGASLAGVIVEASTWIRRHETGALFGSRKENRPTTLSPLGCNLGWLFFARDWLG